MATQKQKAANRLNAGRSTGPKSEAGRRRSAVNARRHGLTSSVESSDSGSHIPEIAKLLKEEGLSLEVAQELARRIVQYERNVAYQRECFIDQLANKPLGRVVTDEAQESLDLAQMLIQARTLGKVVIPGIDEKLSKEMEQFFGKVGERQVRAATRDAERELKSADRYLRRAANQMIKQLRGLEPTID